MGVIKRQSFKSSLVRYLAVLIGGVSALWIFPLELELYGFLIFMLSLVTLCYSIFSFGSIQLVIKYFPFYKNEENGHNGFLANVLLYGVFFLVLFFTIGLFIREPLFDYLEGKSFQMDQLRAHYFSFWGLIVLFYVNVSLVNYSTNFKRLTVPTILNYLLPKIALPIIVVLFYQDKIDTAQAVYGLLILHTLILLCLSIYIGSLGELHLRPKFNAFKKRIGAIFNFASYASLNSVSNLIATKIDQIMVPALVNFSSGGLYAIATFITTVIEIPTNTLLQMTAPFISESWKENDVDKIDFYYKQSSVNLFWLGCLILILIWFSLEDLFSITRHAEVIEKGKYVVLILGFSKLIDMMTSANTQIITYSKYYKFNLYAAILLALLNIGLNYYFLTQLFVDQPLIGAAIATLISMAIYQFLKVIFIYWKFRIHPFSWSTIKVICIAILTVAIGFLLPDIPIKRWIGDGSMIYQLIHLLLNIAFRSLLLALVFVSAIEAWKVSEEASSMRKSLLSKLKEVLPF